VLRLFKPDTVLKWHRDLVRRKWTFAKRRSGGRPTTDPEVLALLLRLVKENLSWGYGRLQGALLKLGYVTGRSTVRDILKRQQIPPAPQRARQGSRWRTFLSHYSQQLLACDFFTVETCLVADALRVFFIGLGSRRVHFAGCTAHPTAEWVTQQARQLTWSLQDEQQPIRFLIRDRSAKFTAHFDTVFAAENIEIIRTPYWSPRANASAERWIRSAREEVLDGLLILNERHLRRVMIEYIEYYNHARPHQGLEQRCPIAFDRSHAEGPVNCRDVLGGIVHDYYRKAACPAMYRRMSNPHHTGGWKRAIEAPRWPPTPLRAGELRRATPQSAACALAGRSSSPKATQIQTPGAGTLRAVPTIVLNPNTPSHYPQLARYSTVHVHQSRPIDGET
jgi:hypothetical protein